MSSPDSPDHEAIDRDFAPPDAGPDRDPRSILINHGIRDNTDTNQILADRLAQLQTSAVSAGIPKAV